MKNQPETVSLAAVSVDKALETINAFCRTLPLIFSTLVLITLSTKPPWKLLWLFSIKHLGLLRTPFWPLRADRKWRTDPTILPIFPRKRHRDWSFQSRFKQQSRNKLQNYEKGIQSWIGRKKKCGRNRIEVEENLRNKTERRRLFKSQIYLDWRCRTCQLLSFWLWK